MADFVYPSPVILNQIATELVPRMAAERAGFDIFPIREADTHILEWEQRDNFFGLQQIRGLNGPPLRVSRVGAKRYLMTPGVYGEFTMIDEQELTTRRAFGQIANFVDVTDLVRDAQDQLLQRRLDRMEQIIWTLASTGTFSVAQGSAVFHTDSYSPQTYSAGTAWATTATSTPLADFRAVQLKSRGFGVDFGGRARAYMNRATFNALMANTNATDLGGRKGTFGQSLTREGVNAVFLGEDLPIPTVYDEGYFNDSNTFTLFVPNNKVIVVGARRDGNSVGEFRLTRNANNDGMAPGAYMRIVDDPNKLPRSIEIHDGFNGGPVIFYPGSIVIMTV